MAITREELQEPEGVVLQFPGGHRRPRTNYLARRVAVGAVVAVVVIVGAALVHDGTSGTRASGRAGTIVGPVAPGDTLWDLARRYSPPGADLRAYVDRLVRANRLTGRPLQAGMRLELPE